jgi:hypothetical protein
MIRALLAGTKTQTRRIVKPQPDVFGLVPLGDKMISAAEWQIRQSGRIKINIGDRLWVRETFTGVRSYGDGPNVLYRADGGPECFIWKPSIFMPRWASRLTLIVTEVRVERLHDITEADAIAEGIEDVTREVAPGDRSLRFWKRYNDGGCNGYVDSPVGSYASLWTEINGAGAWESNPWIVAYTFTVHHGNIDQIAQVAA